MRSALTCTRYKHTDTHTHAHYRVLIHTSKKHTDTLRAANERDAACNFFFLLANCTRREPKVD